MTRVLFWMAFKSIILLCLFIFYESWSGNKSQTLSPPVTEVSSHNKKTLSILYLVWGKLCLWSLLGAFTYAVFVKARFPNYTEEGASALEC